MNTEVFVLCDAATDSGGKLNILGIFDTLWVGQVPTKHHFCSVALRLRFNNQETGMHALRIQFSDPVGAEVLKPFEAQVEVQPSPAGGSSTINTIIYFQNLDIKSFGDYSITCSVNGKNLAALPFYVKAKTKTKKN